MKLFHAFFIILLFPGIASAGTITCGGESWTSIQSALDYAMENPGSTLEFSGEFLVEANQYYIPSNTELTGDATITLALQDRDYPTPKVCRAIFQALDGADNIKIHGLTIDGNSKNDWSVWGNDHVNMIQLFGSSNVEIYDMVFKNGLGDAIKIRHGSKDEYQDENTNIKIHDNVIDRIGHDGIYLFCVSNAEIWNNEIICRDDAGIRVFNSNDLKIHDNIITSKNQGGAGIEIQKHGDPDMNNIQIYDNEISKIRTYGIWVYSYDSDSLDTAYVSIYDNTIKNSNMGISLQGFSGYFENNVVTGSSDEDFTIEKSKEGLSGSGYEITLVDNEIGKRINNELRGLHKILYSGEQKKMPAKNSSEGAEPGYSESDAYLPTIKIPNYHSPNFCEVSIFDNDYMPQTRFKVKTDNLTSKVVYKYANTSSTHYMWTSTRTGKSHNIDMWELEGEASRIGNEFVISGSDINQSESVDIYIYNTAGRKTKLTNISTTVYKENLTDAINPLAYLVIAIIALTCAGISLNLAVTYGKLKRGYKR